MTEQMGTFGANVVVQGDVRPLLRPAARSGGREPALPQRRLTFMRSPVVPLLASLLLAASCAQPSTDAGQASPTGGDHPGMTDREYELALVVAKQEIRGEAASVDSASVSTSTGTVSNPNAGPPCESGRLLRVTLIGTFPHIVTTGEPHDPDDRGAERDFTVRALVVTADARSGLVCLKGVQTGSVAPEPDSIPLPVS